VLDEPTIGLDPAQIRSMRDLITELGQDHTIILSSHILAEVEHTCSQIIIIAGGKIAASGSIAELRQRVIGPSRIFAEVKADDDLVAAVKTLSGAREVTAEKLNGWTRLTIQGDPAADLRSDVYALAAKKGWQLRELRRQVGSLEDFFMQITFEQNARQNEPAPV
jgi:ABC-2 type transport system ATP-binding protein